MKIRQCIYVMVAFSLLLLSCITGWAEKKPVLDDDGNVITEAEIEAIMGGLYNRVGFCIVGGYLSVIPMFLPCIFCDPCACPPMGDAPPPCEEGKEYCETLIFGGVAIWVAGTIASYYIGKHYDRQRAIERIKIYRRQQKKHALGEQETTDGFYFRLLKVTF